MRDAMSVLIRPVVSEKSYALMERSVYVFIVDPRATKIEVRHAVEQAFGVRVTKVNTLNRKGKATRNRRTNVRGQAPRHQARHRDAAPRRLHRPLRALIREPPCHFAHASPPAPVGGSRPSRTSPRSPATHPEKSLLAPKPQSGGRNNYGRKTSRHRGGGHKQQYRIVDFRRNKDGIPAKVAADRVRPQPQRRASPCCTTSTARSATSWPRPA